MMLLGNTLLGALTALGSLALLAAAAPSSAAGAALAKRAGGTNGPFAQRDVPGTSLRLLLPIEGRFDRMRDPWTVDFSLQKPDMALGAWVRDQETATYTKDVDVVAMEGRLSLELIDARGGLSGGGLVNDDNINAVVREAEKWRGDKQAKRLLFCVCESMGDDGCRIGAKLLVAVHAKYDSLTKPRRMDEMERERVEVPVFGHPFYLLSRNLLHEGIDSDWKVSQNGRYRDRAVKKWAKTWEKELNIKKKNGFSADDKKGKTKVDVALFANFPSVTGDGRKAILRTAAAWRAVEGLEEFHVKLYGSTRAGWRQGGNISILPTEEK